MTAAGKRGAWAGLMALAALCVFSGGEAYYITVQDVECVSEKVIYVGDTVSGNFVVVGKQQMNWYADMDDIEMVVTGPAGDRVLGMKAKGGSKFEFKAGKSGLYKFCFTNPIAIQQTVEFVLHVGHVPAPEDVAKDEHFNPVKAMIARLGEAVNRVSQEQQYYKARDVRHKRTNESTSNRLLCYTLMEYVALILFSVAQVFLVQRLFSKRIGYNKV